jgi:hypothetical protein
MRFIFFLGGFCGFVVAGATGLWAEHALDRVLLDAAIGCFAGALLFRSFWNAVLRGIREAYLARRAAATAAVSAAPAAPAKPHS